jgi:hypothetical protein
MKKIKEDLSIENAGEVNMFDWLKTKTKKRNL